MSKIFHTFLVLLIFLFHSLGINAQVNTDQPNYDERLTKYITEFNKVIIEKNEKKEVVIGLQDYFNTEIISGLDTNETIYLPKK